MKKLFLLFFLMTISLGQSQTLRLGFETGESGNANGPFGGFAIQPLEAGTGSNTSRVLPIVANAAGQIWQGCNFVLTSPVELIASKTMTIDVLSSTPVTFLLKVNGGVAGAAEAAAQASHNGDGTWQTISFTFNTSLDGKAATANGVYNNMVIHPFFPFNGSASARTFYIDNIRGPGVTPPSGNCTNGIQDGTETGVDCGGSCSPCPPPAPAVAAPTPSQASADVISVFSGTYTDLANTNFYPNWGQTTQYAPFTVAGNATLRYSRLNYQGITFAAPVDATAMTTLHFDIWTPDCTSFQMFVLDGSNPEEQVTVTPTLSGWNSYDIPLSSYPNLTKSNLREFKIVGNGTVYLDNIFFWKVPAGTNTYYADADGDGFGAGAATLSTATTPPTGFSVNNTDCNDNNVAVFPGATEIADGLDNDCDSAIDEGFPPSIAAPTPPARNAWDVVSIFSGAYSNVTLDELPTAWSGLNSPFSVETIGGNPTWKFDGEFLGMVTNYANGINLTQMTTMHIDYWTPDAKIMIAKIVNTVDGVSEGLTIVQDPVVTGTWRSVDIPMAAFGGSVNKSKITQILLDPQSGGSTVYVDNFYFYRPATGAPTATLGAFTVPAKVIGDANFTLTAPSSNSAGAITYTSSNEAVATISGTTVTIVGAGSTIITVSQAAAGSFGAASTTATLVVSLATAATTPTIPADRVLSIFSGAAGYANVAGTQFYPNWGQSTQYALESIAGNPTLRYSNLNYQGIQLGSVIDISSQDSIHLDIYGAGTSSVVFRVINQVGGAGSSDVAREANTTITLNPGWNSVVIPVSSLTTTNPDFELNRVGQLMFIGSGTIYVDNIFFSKAIPTAVAPTVSNVSFCKGLSTQLTAIPSGNNPLRWFTVATGGTALSVAPTPTATTTYHVAQVMSNGVVSPRARLVATMVALPTEAVGTITSNTAGTTAGTFAAATLAVGPFVGTATTVSYRVPEFVGANSYLWTVPAGVRIVGQAEGVRTVTQTGANGNVLNVNYSGIAAGIGSVGAITVQAQNSNGCNGTAKSITLTKALPVAPAAIVMHDLSRPNSLLTGLPVAVTSFARYMGTSTVLTLTATPSLTATSYEWNLPAGVNQLSGGTTNVITVNFAGVTSGNTDNFTTIAGVSTNVLRIGVKAVNGVGVSTTSNTALANPTTTSAARLLTLTAVRPASPTLKMFDMAVSTTVAVTDISRYIGTNTPLTLVGTVPATTLASSFSWELADGVNVVAGSVLSSSTIMVNFEDVAPGTTSLYVGIKAENGMGASVKNNSALLPATSSTASLLKLSAGLPSAAGTVVGSLAICSNQASSVTYTITAAAAKTSVYIITSPVGTTITGGTGNTRTIDAVAGATFTVNYPNGFTSVRPTQRTISIQSVNGFGVSATNKVLTLTSNTCTITSRTTAKMAPIAQEFKVIAYPNPSSSVFNLAIESSNKAATTIQVYDMQGRMIERKQVNTNAVEIGANYTSGIYNVILENAGQAKTIRLIKK